MSKKTKQFSLIRQWGKDKGILPFAPPEKQLLKTVEEVGEVAKALIEQDLEGIKDGIGDVAVTLTLLADLCGLTIEECIEAAWEEIKDRSGEMKDGAFIRNKD